MEKPSRESSPLDLGDSSSRPIAAPTSSPSTSDGTHDKREVAESIVSVQKPEEDGHLQLSSANNAGRHKESFRRRHRRNPAAIHINPNDTYETQGQSRNDKKTGNPEGRHQEHGILSPEPISPAGQLRVRNSIPQFMDALPPSSIDAEADYKSVCEESTTDSEIPTQLLFSSPLKSSIRLDFKPDSSLSNSGAPITPGAPRTPQNLRPGGSSKFNFKPKLSRSFRHHASPTLSIEEIPERSSSYAAKKKVRMKTPRNRLSHGNPHKGRNFRSSKLRNCNSGQGAEQESAFESQREKTCQKKTPGQQMIATGGLKPIDETHVPPITDTEAAEAKKLTASPVLMYNHQAITSQLALTRSRSGLRQKLSFLRLRPIDSAISKSGRKSHDRSFSPSGTRRALETSYMDLDEPVGKRSFGIRKGSQPVGKEWRVHRWVVEAKRTMRSYISRTLDRSSSSEN